VPPLHLPQCARTRLFERFRNLRFAPTKPVAEMERLLLSRRGRAKGLRLFTSGSALDVGPVRWVGLAMAAWRAGVSLMVLVRGLTCGCSPKGAQHPRTIEILQVDTVKKAIGHIVSVGLTARHG
jgi:hypothetical protein